MRISAWLCDWSRSHRFTSGLSPTTMEAVAAKLRETDILTAGHMLARAFHNDPLQVHVFPDAEERAQRAPAQFSALVRQGSLFGQVFMTERMTGISIWMPPGTVVTAEQAAASGYHELPLAMGNEAFTRFAKVLDYLSDVHGNATPAQHWYLIAVGVNPDQQRCGHGHALLRPTMARASAEGVPICLETAQPMVRAFYERLGFKSAIESVDPESGLRFWTYQRDP
jgi:ribosomal protein S18 acetylase RimI-like enzyme